MRNIWMKCSGVFLAMILLLSGCETAVPEKLNISGFAFDTTYTLTVYQGGNQELLNSCVKKCTEFEKIFSRTRSDSELYGINTIEKLYLEVWQEETGEESVGENWEQIAGNALSHQEVERYERLLLEKLEKEGIRNQKFSIMESGAIQIEISEEMKQLLQKGLEYGELSGGGFDITICPISSLWDFTSEKKEVPQQEALEEAISYVNYQKVSIVETKNCVEFAIPGMALDLGGIAKGYIADRLKEYLIEGGVTSGIISLGGNILCIGSKSENEQFQIGIQQPFAERNETIAAIEAEDVSVVSSGVYERYFESEGNLYHHILNPKTGYSYDNDLIGVTIVSKESVDGDGLSTTVFSMGLEKGIKQIESLENVEAMFISKDEKIHYSSGFKKMLSTEQ